ncbi:aminopeptidase P N-terminal domain-containing protein [Sulfurimonas sp. MAG313]|nr:aminopeptidase P N-terminal domain-containing protein [Sulfurimonas sp. MAG313]MDF1880244.1 aminopeptidase P N-terminal domain-containing protein [Sulfurimonas sp. MAG313]
MKTTTYKNRRNKLLEMMQEGVALIPSALLQIRSNDTEFPFRQDTSFYYLSGFDEPECLLLLCKNDKESKSIIFLREKNPEMEMWVGKRLGVMDAAIHLDVNEAYDISKLEEYLPKLLEAHSNLYTDTFSDNIYLNKAKKVCQSLLSSRTVHISPKNFLHLPSILEKQRLIKEDYEIEQIKKALGITEKAHHAAMAMAGEGKNEFEIQALIEYIFKKEGSKHDAYGSIVAGGNNANTLHYIENSMPLKEGDLMLIDAGCEWNYYASDITRTTPVNGKFSPAQKDLYEGILKVQEKIIQDIKPGISKLIIQEKSEILLVTLMKDLGILHGSVEEIIEKKLFKKYYPHGIGHWMGLDVHDTCPYKDEEAKDILFVKGMVLTVEPGIYLPKDDMGIPEKYRGIGIRIEDNILVTSKGCENLSIGIAKTVKEIENICQRDYKEFL